MGSALYGRCRGVFGLIIETANLLKVPALEEPQPSWAVGNSRVLSTAVFGKLSIGIAHAVWSEAAIVSMHQVEIRT